MIVTSSPLQPLIWDEKELRQWSNLAFAELSAATLLELLSLRQEVFLIEQNSLYRDLDGQDPISRHLFRRHGPVMVAYTRLQPPLIAGSPLVIGRLVLHPQARHCGLGSALLSQALAWADTHCAGVGQKLSAQHHLRHWYQRFGFQQRGEPYDDGGILHIDMERAPQVL